MTVDAATDAYLQLIPAAREAMAVSYTRSGYWVLLGSKLVALVVAVLLARVDLSRWLPAGLASPAKPNRRAMSVSACMLLAVFVLELPWFAYADWARERSYGFSRQALGSWIADYAVQSLITAIVGAVLLAAFYAAARSSGRRWWLWGAGVAGAGLVLGLVVQPVALAPLLNNYRPAPSGEMLGAVQTLLARGGVRGDRVFVYDGSRRSSRYTASVTGIGRSATVALSDAMFARGADAAQVKAVVAHELGHQRHVHRLLLVLALTAIVAAGLLLTDRLFGSVARSLGKGGTRVSDPAGLPILLAIFAVYTLVTTPLVNTVERLVEADADRYGLALAREPDGMARAVLATADYRASTPTELEEILFYDHPSNARRIEAAMRWKAAHVPPAAARKPAAAGTSAPYPRTG